jgi:hypothetical protein
MRCIVLELLVEWTQAVKQYRKCLSCPYLCVLKETAGQVAKWARVFVECETSNSMILSPRHPHHAFTQTQTQTQTFTRTHAHTSTLSRTHTHTHTHTHTLPRAKSESACQRNWDCLSHGTARQKRKQNETHYYLRYPYLSRSTLHQ